MRDPRLPGAACRRKRRHAGQDRHIYAAEKGGPRFNSKMSNEDRRSFDRGVRRYRLDEEVEGLATFIDRLKELPLEERAFAIKLTERMRHETSTICRLKMWRAHSAWVRPSYVSV